MDRTIVSIRQGVQSNSRAVVLGSSHSDTQSPTHHGCTYQPSCSPDCNERRLQHRTERANSAKTSVEREQD